MYGAILGDIIGSPYEFNQGSKSKDFPLFIKESRFTDDSVMTIAIAQGILDSIGLASGCSTMGMVGAENWKDERMWKEAMIDSMHRWGQQFPNAGYGGTFYHWLALGSREPYNSWGNGSAMRVASVGWLFRTLEDTRKVARWSAEVTHNHPEGIKGAEAVASVIWMARNGHSKKEIKLFVEKEFCYDLSRTCDQIRPTYKFDVSCQGTVPEAITAFLEGTDFEDVIRTAVSLGGDCDTLTCIAGSMAEAFYPIPEPLIQSCLDHTTEEMHQVLHQFDALRFLRQEGRERDAFVGLREAAIPRPCYGFISTSPLFFFGQ